MIMPSFALSLIYMALLSRLIRSDMLDVLGLDYIRSARAKGLTELKVIMKHAFRNSMIPALTLTTINFAALLGGSVIVETIFALPGVGRLMIKAIYARDFPVIQGITMIVGVVFLLSSLLSDLLMTVIDPRIRTGKRE